MQRRQATTTSRVGAADQIRRYGSGFVEGVGACAAEQHAAAAVSAQQPH